jgi:hypothetical protein
MNKSCRKVARATAKVVRDVHPDVERLRADVLGPQVVYAGHPWHQVDGLHELGLGRGSALLIQIPRRVTLAPDPAGVRARPD